MDRQDWLDQRSNEEKDALYRAELEYYSEKMVTNIDDRIVFINEKYADEFDRTPSEIEGMMFNDLFLDAKAPVLLDLSDFATPFVSHDDETSKQPKRTVFIRAPLLTDKGEKIGNMIYDGYDWLQRYRSLYIKLNELMDEFEYLHPSKKRSVSDSFIGSSPAILRLKREILQAAKTNATVLIEGETGTGKEVVSNEIYRASSRSHKPFVKLNCAALPRELIESELFGYAEGAFTGARRHGKKGLFEVANGGVILLDEINSLDLPSQAKLLRVLQERVVNPIGSGDTIPIDVRVIAVSNCPLEEMVRSKAFREDLYYRLNVLHIQVPPLRARIDDIPDLVSFFVKRCNTEMQKNVTRIDPQIFSYLKTCPWPGNVRQLQNWVERAMTTVWKELITLDNFYWIEKKETAARNELDLPSGLTLHQAMEQIERKLIQDALERNKGNKKAAAVELGISRQMLPRKLHQRKLD